MILKFADLETLRLVLVADAIPAAVSQTPVLAGFDDQEALWVDTPANLARAAQTELRRHGVQICKTTGSVVLTEYSCWAQLLPLVRREVLPEQLGQNPVVFVFNDSESLSRLAIEVLRLGNDRQSYRWLEPTKADEPAVGILRVIGPPYYSLLRAIDRIGGENAPEAFLERSPRVWVQFGYDHPLADNLKAPEGRMLLLRAPRRWQQLEEAPYRDIYEVLEFPLPEQPLAHEKGDLAGRLEVSLALKSGGSSDGAELWVLTENPVAELNTLVQNADDQLLHRLAFAVGKASDGSQTIVLRTRQSKMQPPVLVLNARGYKPYLKLPNLFLPVGTRLHPPLRRDKVRQLLAEDAAHVVWLAPTEDAGEFTPESLPEDAFRPLWDWVDYVLDHDKAPLEAWVQASQFDFEPFVCDEDTRPEKPKKSPGDEKKEKKEKKGSPAGNLPADDSTRFEPRKQTEDDALLDDPLALDVKPAEPSLVQKMLKEMEEQFVTFEGGMDAEERRALWPELARLNGELGNVDEAGLCYGHHLWGHDLAPVEMAWRWFRTEAQNVSGKADARGQRAKTWTTRVTTVQKANRDLDGADLDALLSNPEPSLADLRALTAYLVFAARKSPPPPALVERLNQVHRFLEAHERNLPIRFTWLAWIHLAQLSKGDVLALARARDRVLERLYSNGLRPEQDLPSFLRFAGQPTSQRFRAVRRWMTKLAEVAQEWVKKDTTGQTPMTAYIDLIFGFGLARLGEVDEARKMEGRAHAALKGKDDVHQFLLNAYGYRIKQALDGKPHGGPLPAERVEELAKMDRMPRYVVDRLRQHSKILEPNERIDPYRYWGGRISELDKTLADLVDLTDKGEIQKKIRQLLVEHGKGNAAKNKENTARIIRAALDLAPRINEDFARDMLERAMPAYDALPEPTDQPSLMDQALFLEKALAVAAHFDRVEHVHPLVGRFQKMLQSQKGDKAVQSMEALAGQCFKGLRKLGMREEIGSILTQMYKSLSDGQDVRALDAGKFSPAALRAMLHVAAGWYYFGKDREADPVITSVRQVLFKEEGLSCKEKTLLACTYAATVGQAPVESAQKLLEELFKKLTGIKDTYTTNTYYSLSQLDVIEAVVLAVVSDDFTLGTNARRWLDDDEYLVRKRIHRDMRGVLGKE